MKHSVVDVVLRQQQRVDASARLAGLFLEESAQSALKKLSQRLARLAATVATPTSQSAYYSDRLPAQLERLVRDVGLLRIDDPLAIARVEWVVAEIEEMLRGGQKLAV